MKLFLIAAASVAALAVSAPAMAQMAPFNNVSLYGNLGWTDFSGAGTDLSAITGRLGARFGQYVGIEGELSGGIGNRDDNGASAHLANQEAVYAIGFLPVMPNADLFARIGYGESDYHVSQNGNNFGGHENSVNYGVGGQYFFDRSNGVRLDYTREETTSDHGPDSNLFGVSYVHKF